MLGLAEECRMLMQSDDNFLIRCGVDGIAFLSLDADVKEDLVGDPEALQGLYKGQPMPDSLSKFRNFSCSTFANHCHVIVIFSAPRWKIFL